MLSPPRHLLYLTDPEGSNGWQCMYDASSIQGKYMIQKDMNPMSVALLQIMPISVVQTQRAHDVSSDPVKLDPVKTRPGDQIAQKACA